MQIVQEKIHSNTWAGNFPSFILKDSQENDLLREMCEKTCTTSSYLTAGMRIHTGEMANKTDALSMLNKDGYLTVCMLRDG
jgi:hypothetical protein